MPLQIEYLPRHTAKTALFVFYLRINVFDRN